MGESNLKIALTGAMGSGKSRVAELFLEQGARVIDADKISRLLLEPSEKGWSALQAEFGELFLNDDLTVDRKKLRASIFSDESLREKINSILHPLIKYAINGICAEKTVHQSVMIDGAGCLPITVVEVPLLFEVGWQDDFDLVIVVCADEETCLKRVMVRDGVDRQSALAAFASQMSLAKKIRMADYVIDNNGEMEATARQVKELCISLSS